MDQDGLASARMLPRRRTPAARHARGRAARHQPAGIEPVAGAAPVRSRRAVVPARRPLDPSDQARRAVPGAGGARARRDRQWPPRARRFQGGRPRAGVARVPAHAGRQIHSGAGAPLQPGPSGACVLLSSRTTAPRSKRSSNAASWTLFLWRCRPARPASTGPMSAIRSSFSSSRAAIGWPDAGRCRLQRGGQRTVRVVQAGACDPPHDRRSLQGRGFLAGDQLRGRRLQQRAGVRRGGLRGCHRPARSVRIRRRGEPQDYRAGGAARHRPGLDGRPLLVSQCAAVS